MVEIDCMEYSVTIGDSKYSVHLGDDGLVFVDGEELVHLWLLEEAELKVALTVLRHNPPGKEELIFARKTCGLSREVAYLLYGGTYSVESIENGGPTDTAFNVYRKKYINMLMDECIRQLRAIDITRKVSCGEADSSDEV